MIVHADAGSFLIKSAGRREHALVPYEREGWFLLIHESNGPTSKAWRLYAMRPDQDHRTGEPVARQSLEVYQDRWSAVADVAEGKVRNPYKKNQMHTYA
jgi:hypothetical protein